MDPPVILALLPIHPPKIHAVFFVRMMDDVEVLRHVLRIENVQLAGRAVGRTAEGLTHLRIHILEIAHACGRMQIERGLQIVRMNIFEKLLVVGEQFLIPGVTGPAVAPVGDLSQMPIHIHDGNREGNVLLLEFFHQIQIFLLGIGVIAAPPVAQRIGRQKRRRTGQAAKILHGSDIIVRPVPTYVDPAVGQHHALAVVQHGKAALGTDAVFHGDASVDTVERGGRTAQRFGRIAVVPNVRPVAQRDLQAFQIIAATQLQLLGA